MNLALSNPGGGGTIGSAATAVLEIQDDEPHVSLSAATYTVSEGAGFLTVTVVRGGVDTAHADRGLRDRRPVPGREPARPWPAWTTRR